METLEQYRARVEANRSSFSESQRLLDEVKWCNQLKERKVFTLVDQAEAIEIEANARTRGAVIAFLKNVTNFHADWLPDNEGKTFMLSLNENEGDPFYGKKTDSLYQGINSHLSKSDELKQAWRLIKKSEGDGDDKVTHLYIVHL